MNDDPAGLIIPIRGAKIHYLDREHLLQNLNVNLMSQNGARLKVNHLQLAAMSKNILLGQDLNDEIFITTNLETHDLSLVANFITEGLLPLPIDELRRHIPTHLDMVFQSFGIFLDQILNQSSMLIKKEPFALHEVHEDIKKENILDVKIEEEPSEILSNDILDSLPDFFDDPVDIDQDTELLPLKKPRKRRKKADIHSESEDEDWKPEAPKTPKNNRRSTKKVDYSDNTIEDIFKEKPKRGPYKKKKPDSNLSRFERDLKNQCEKFIQDHPNVANLSIPDEENPESKAFETYHLPCEIDTYKSPPKKIEKLNTVQDHLHPYPCPSCPGWLNNPYALKNHQLLYHSEHYQCSYCKHVSPLSQSEDFKLHMFR